MILQRLHYLSAEQFPTTAYRRRRWYRWRQQLSGPRKRSCDLSACLEQDHSCQRTISISLLHKSINIHLISFPLEGCVDIFQNHSLFFFLLQLHSEPHRYIFGPFLQKRGLQWELGLSFEARQSECSWFCVGCIYVLAGKLWDEVCPLRQGWTMMDQTQILTRAQKRSEGLCEKQQMNLCSSSREQMEQ